MIADVQFANDDEFEDWCKEREDLEVTGQDPHSVGKDSSY